MPIENIQELYQLVLGTLLFAHSLHAGLQVAKVAKVARPRNHWRDQRPSNGAVVFYDAEFSANSEAFGLIQVSKMLRQLTGQILAHYFSSKIRNTHLRLFRSD